MNLFARIKDWWLWRKALKDFDKEVIQNVNMWGRSDPISHVQDDEAAKQKLYNGLTLMKRRLKQSMNGFDPTLYLAKYYSNEADLLALAKDEDSSKKALRETKEAAFVYKGTDLKTENDKLNMVDERISHYNKLQKNIESRALLRQARTAYNNGNLDEQQKLLKEWNSRYGKFRNY